MALLALNFKLLNFMLIITSILKNPLKRRDPQLLKELEGKVRVLHLYDQLDLQRASSSTPGQGTTINAQPTISTHNRIDLGRSFNVADVREALRLASAAETSLNSDVKEVWKRIVAISARNKTDVYATEYLGAFGTPLRGAKLRAHFSCINDKGKFRINFILKWHPLTTIRCP